LSFEQFAGKTAPTGALKLIIQAVNMKSAGPGRAVLLAISRAFGKSVDWLLTGEERK